jgi:LETM1 and EF-hand domain-containing protein 1, mitochondrial
MWRASIQRIHFHVQPSRLPRTLVSRHRHDLFPSCNRIIPSHSASIITDYRNLAISEFKPDFLKVQSSRFHTSALLLDKENTPLRPSSKVEETIIAFKQDLKKEHEKKPLSDGQSTTLPSEQVPPVIQVKPSLWTRVVNELKHYYHGFRLLFIDIRISSGLLMRLLQGEMLTRREKKQLVRTTSDAFRLVPFSVFIIVPFMEFTLPIFLKLFPNMLPSTFQTANEKEAKMKSSLKVKLEMAKFLQQTLDEMALKGRGHQSQTAKEFADFFHKIRQSGTQATNEEIIRFSKWFEDEITLDSLSRPQLTALCRVLEIAPIGTNNLLRFQLRMRLRSLVADDKLIQKEGIDSLTIPELQSACRARGMRALGISEIRLKSQLLQWLDLSLNQRVPPSLLLLSRALYLPDDILPSDQLKATIAALPESVATQTLDAISERRGKIDNAARIQALKLEEAKIKEERSEMAASSTIGPVLSADTTAVIPQTPADQELMVDKAPVLEDKAVLMKAQAKEQLTSADVAALENALENIGVQRKRLLIEKEELDELKEEMAEYQEDIEELKDFLDTAARDPGAGPERRRLELRESKAARRLFRSVNRMIGRLDGIVGDLETRQNRLKESRKKKKEGTTSVIPAPPAAVVTTDAGAVEEIVSIEELISSIRRLQAVEDSSKLQQIVQVLGQIDQDQDGAVKVDHVMKVLLVI